MASVVDPAGLLEALAKGGSQGAQAYKDSQAALAAQQQAATQAALSGSLGLSAGAQGAVGGIIGQGYAPTQDRLTSNAASDQAFHTSLAGSVNSFQTTQRGVLDKLLQQQAEDAAMKAASGSGSGSGSGKEPPPEDWWNADLKAQFDTKDNLYSYLATLPGQGRTPSFQVQQAKARELGVPDLVAQTRFPTPDMSIFVRKAARGVPISRIRTTYAKAQAAGDIGAPDRRFYVDQYRAATAANPTYAKLRRKVLKKKGR